MNITFIGFGKVAFSLTQIVNSPDINFITSKENRSHNTINLIKKANIKITSTFREAIEISDIVISANTPSQALNVAQSYLKNYNGIYLDLNNISPKTTLKIAQITNNFVDGAIMGKIDSDNPTIYLSGEKAYELDFLNEYLNIKIISDNIGDASLLKMLRSTYTKSLSALLIESYDVAFKFGLEDEFFDILSLTEGKDFKEKSLSRIHNTKIASKRKSEELEEIIDYFSDEDLSVIKAACEKLKKF